MGDVIAFIQALSSNSVVLILMKPNIDIGKIQCFQKVIVVTCIPKMH